MFLSRKVINSLLSNDLHWLDTMTLSSHGDCDNDCKVRSEQRSLTACFCGLGATQNVYVT